MTRAATPRKIDRILERQGLPISNEPNATIVMTDSEGGNLLRALLRPSIKTYVEWGSGGSTELVSWLILSGSVRPDFRAVSIESSASWMAHMRRRSNLVRLAEQTGKMVFVHGSMEPVGHLGYPKYFSPRDLNRSRSYVSLNNKLGGRLADVALVDGRFRLACMLEALKHLRRSRRSHHGTPHSPMVLLHDFAVIPPGLHRRRFEEYSVALQFYELQWMNDTLATLTPKRTTSANAVSSALKSALGRPDR